jgi:hypothetical protein
MSIPLHMSADSIADILKLSDARISFGDCWMVWDEHFKNYVIYQKKYRKRNATIIFEIQDEATAAREFIKLTAE